jgi:simple sugar transport system ATP-binding protein
MAVIFITHRLHEVMRCADAVTVLRLGKVVLQQSNEQINQNHLAEAIIGEISSSENYTLPKMGNKIFHTTKLCSNGSPPIQNINIELHQSQIMGIAGVAGNGQDTLINTLLGITKTKSGKIELQEQSIETKTVAQRRNAGIALIPQDRRKQALLTTFPIWENVLLNRSASNMQSKFWMNATTVQTTTSKLIGDYTIKASSPNASVSSLSGGHQQRVIIARELSTKPKVIIAYDPTRGLDIRASRFVHEQLIHAAKEGASVMLFSSELSELFLMCHNIAVMHNGELSPPRAKEDWTQESLGHAMTGGSA